MDLGAGPRLQQGQGLQATAGPVDTGQAARGAGPAKAAAGWGARRGGVGSVPGTD